MNKMISSAFPFIIYYIIVLILMLLGVFLPKSTGAMWLWGWCFYIPYIFFGVYLAGFVLGMVVQKRSRINKIYQHLLLSAIIFSVSFVAFLIPAMQSILTYGILRNAIYTIIPAIGSACLFLIGQIARRNKRMSPNKHSSSIKNI